MTNRRSYGELERALERQSRELEELRGRLSQMESDRAGMERALEDSDKRLQGILENSFDVIYRFNLAEDRFDYVSPSARDLIGFDPDEARQLGFSGVLSLVHPDDRDWMKEHFARLAVSEDKSSSRELRIRHREWGYRWVSDTRTLVLDEDGQPAAIVGTVRDISREKQAEEELQRIRDRLETMVRERTANLEEANTALKVLLRQREEDLKEIEEKIQLNVRNVVIPFVQRLRKTEIGSEQRALLDRLEVSLNDVTSPFIRSLSTKYLDLTHAEVEVANLVREGKSTKEIAELLGMSPRTIETHRYSIRKKLGLKRKSQNLVLHLRSLS